jgi:threonine/homoserine/homoserine lactone efflux protein
MLSVLIQSLLLATSGLLSVGSITLVILLLISDRGWRNGLGYALGYFFAYSLIGAGTVGLGYRAAENGAGEPGLFLPIMLLVLGSLLLWLSLRNWRQPPTETQEPPRFFRIVDDITPLKAFGFGALVTVMNVKNLALFMTAVSVVILSPLPFGQKMAVTLLDALVFCLSVIIPVLIYVSFPRRAKEILLAFRGLLERNGRAIGIWLPLIFGLIFIVKGATSLFAR